jgi:hypothetical protein
VDDSWRELDSVYVPPEIRKQFSSQGGRPLPAEIRETIAAFFLDASAVQETFRAPPGVTEYALRRFVHALSSEHRVDIDLVKDSAGLHVRKVKRKPLAGT